MEPTLPQTLLLVRHAIALPADEFDGPDAARPLTAKGSAKAAKVFAKLVKLYRPTRIVTSPLVRAKATAELFAAALARPRPDIEQSEALRPEGTVEQWRQEIARLAFDADDVAIIFGHEPSLGQLFASHLGCPLPIAFKKAGIAILEPKSLATAKLVAFLPPKIFLEGAVAKPV